MPAMVSIAAATLAVSAPQSSSAAASTGRRQFDGRHSPVVRVVDAFGGLPDTDDDRRARINSAAPPIASLCIVAAEIHGAYRLCRICRASAAVSDGVLPTFTPAASSASFLAAAVPDDPDTMAPAWPIVLPSGAVNPAT